MESDFISREAAIRSQCGGCSPALCSSKCDAVIAIEAIPAADVVARDCYDRILAENDTMRKQLAQIGKNPGGTMDDVRPVVLCRDCHWWTKQEEILKGRCELIGFCPPGEWFCANGERSDMREPNLDATKGEDPLQKETAMSKYRVRYFDD